MPCLNYTKSFIIISFIFTQHFWAKFFHLTFLQISDLLFCQKCLYEKAYFIHYWSIYRSSHDIFKIICSTSPIFFLWEKFANLAGLSISKSLLFFHLQKRFTENPAKNLQRIMATGNHIQKSSWHRVVRTF